MTVDDRDLWTLLLCTVRYSMGRSTYMSSYAPEMVLRYRAALSAEQLAQVRDEVLTELRLCEARGRTLGDGCDHTSWQRFTDALAVPT